jgi:polysaccharide biosynthesis/export protein
MPKRKRTLVGVLRWAALGCAALAVAWCSTGFSRPTTEAPMAYAMPPADGPWDCAAPADGEIQLCQALSPAAPYPICGIDQTAHPWPVAWEAAQPLDWQPYAQGEYAAHERLPHVPQYRIRVDDTLELVYRVTRNQNARPYTLNVGDEIRLESSADPQLDRNLLIQPDGTITLRLIGQVKATRRTVPQLREEVEQLYTQYYKAPAITITPVKVNTKLEDLRATVDKRFGFGGQSREAHVTPEGTIALPAIGSVFTQGLTLNELKRELDERYAMKVEGIEVTPVLLKRAPRFVYVLGEVQQPGRVELLGPTTVMQAISMGGGWNPGGNLRQVVVFRRGDDWRLMATLLDVRGALYGKVPTPADEVWLNDSDIVVVPKAPIRVFDDAVALVFTQGLYGIAPFRTATMFTFLSTL